MIFSREEICQKFLLKKRLSAYVEQRVSNRVTHFVKFFCGVGEFESSNEIFIT